MISLLRPTLRRAVGLLALFGAVSCGSGESVVLVKVTGGVTGIRQLAVTFKNDGVSATRQYPPAASAVDINLPTSFSATVPSSHTGPITVQVIALSAATMPIAMGETTGSLVVGGQTGVTVVLGSCSGVGCLFVDAGPPDAPGPDVPPSICSMPGSEGIACGSPDVCNNTPICHLGMCTPQPKMDGTSCGSGDACNNAPTCMSGKCVLNPKADGTQCASAPDVCHMAPVCASGVCQPAAPQPNGTSCGSASACQGAPTCMSGTCTPNNLPDGTTCGSAPDACHGAPTCTGGVCGSAPSLPDGTVCGTAPDACHNAPACTGGVCGSPTNKPNGTSCPAITCHNAGTCQSGACQAGSAVANGTQWGGAYIDRCCGGNPVTINTNSNCGACNVNCAGTVGGCQAVHGYYFCVCNSNASCWSGCCDTFYGAPNACAASNCSGSCISCPAGSNASCVVDGPNYCHY